MFSRAVGLNPAAETFRVYVPGWRNRKLYTPTSLALAEETSVVLALRNSRAADGTAIPAGSVTVIVSLARKSCAAAANRAMRATRLRETARKRWSERHMAQTSWFTPTSIKGLADTESRY